MSGSQGSVLVIDDSQELIDCYRDLLVEEGYKVISATSCEQGLEKLAHHLPLSLILVDYSLPVMSGEEFVNEFKKRFPESFRVTPVVVFSGHSSSSPIANSVRATGAKFLEKTNDIFEFVQSLTGLVA